MRISFRLCLLATLTLFATINAKTAFAEEFRVDNLFIIGDSLSDAGTYAQGVVAGSGGVLPVAPRYRFLTNNLDGSSLVWAEHLANLLGIPAGPDVLQGVSSPPAPVEIPTIDLNGGNYAEGGARVSQQPGVIGGLTPAQGFTTRTGVEQIDRLLADKPRLDQNDLIAVWLGSNDVFTQFAGVVGDPILGLPPTISLQTATANMDTAANDLIGQVQRLIDAGAKNIIVTTVPDIGITPFGVASGAQGAAILTSLGDTFNNRLKKELVGKPVVIVDAGKLLTAVTADPARYGFTSPNALLPACGDPTLNPILSCLQGSPLTAADSEQRVYADSVHPTATAHALFGQAAFAGLQAASQAGAIPVATLTALRQQSIGLEKRLNPTAFAAEDEESGRQAIRKVGDIDVFASVEGGYYEADAQQVAPGVSATTQVIKVGGDIMVAKNALVGLGFSNDYGQLEFDGDRGGFDSRLFVGALYGQVALSQSFYINAATAGGIIDVYEIERSFALGPARERYESDSDGYYYALRGGGGFLVRSGSWIFNPAASITYEKVSIDGYTESSGAASVSFGQLEFDALRLTGSLTATYVPPNPKDWKAILRASVEYDLEDEDIKIPTGPDSETLGFVTAPRPDKGFGYLTAEFIKPLSGQSSFGVAGSSVVGLNGSLGLTGTLIYKMDF